MNTSTRQTVEWECLNVARWSSVLVALLVGYFFMADTWFWQSAINDKPYLVDVILKHRFDSGLILVMLVGYALAWQRKYETLGSIVALLSLATAYLSYTLVFPPGPSPYLLAFGIPALFHLLADYLHKKTESVAPKESIRLHKKVAA